MKKNIILSHNLFIPEKVKKYKFSTLDLFVYSNLLRWATKGMNEYIFPNGNIGFWIQYKKVSLLWGFPTTRQLQDTMKKMVKKGFLFQETLLNVQKRGCRSFFAFNLEVLKDVLDLENPNDETSFIQEVFIQKLVDSIELKKAHCGELQKTCFEKDNEIVIRKKKVIIENELNTPMALSKPIPVEEKGEEEMKPWNHDVFDEADYTDSPILKLVNEKKAIVKNDDDEPKVKRETYAERVERERHDSLQSLYAQGLI